MGRIGRINSKIFLGIYNHPAHPANPCSSGFDFPGALRVMSEHCERAVNQPYLRQSAQSADQTLRALYAFAVS